MSITDGFLKWWLRRGRYGWSKLRRRLFERRYLTTALPQVNSLDDIQACLRQVTWTMDSPLHLYDSISYPQTVWATKKDDCDGFAVLAAALLRGWSPATDPVLVTVMVKPVSASHTVCVFRHGGDLWYFSNSDLLQGNYASYGDIVAIITAGTSRLIGWDVVKPDTLETLEFHTA